MRNLFIEGLITLRQSYWFWPSILTAFALVLGFAMPVFDGYVGSDWMQPLPFLRPLQVDGARDMLTTLASAVLGVAGVSFSITMVAVTFASGNYGPRLIGNFMRDRTNQLVLGVFLSTFVYCIAVLSRVHDESDIAAVVPQISILFAIVLTLASVGALIVYIHHVPESINIMNLVARIGGELERAIAAMLVTESERDEKCANTHDDPGVAAWSENPVYSERATSIRSHGTGYLQWIDLERLDAIAAEADVQIVLVRSAGDFVVEGEPIMTVRPAERLDERHAADLAIALTLGANRTELQDVLFLSDELVEVLARALSPGVNDPHTAMLCLDWLRAGLSILAREKGCGEVSPRARVLYTRVTFERMIESAFSQMRQYIAADRNVTLHAIGTLSDLAAEVSDTSRIAALDEQAETLATSAHERQAESAAKAEIDAAMAAYQERKRRGDAGVIGPRPG
nr:DUF2254 domain-containing protein [Acuticoccus kalidii]